jgi:hypothetical protein
VAQLFGRPARTVTIRTRLDASTIRRCLEGLGSSGRFEGVYVVGDSFLARYMPPGRACTVEGRLRTTEEWRFFDVWIVADEPWLTGRLLLALLAFAALKVAWGRMGWRTAVGMLACVCVAQWTANLVSSGRRRGDDVARAIAAELRGSVREGNRWVVTR